MKHGYFDRFSDGDTLAHRLDPRAKIILVATYVVSVVSTPPPHLLAFVVFAGLISWACAISRVPLSHIWLRALGVLPFAFFASFLMPFLKEGETISIFNGSINLSVTGLWIFAGVMMKSFLGASATIWLISTTPFNSLLRGVRMMGAPIILVDLLALIYRYIFVLVSEAMHLKRAAAARGYRPRWLAQAILIGRLIGRLFVRSYERAERIYDAMVLRGFTGQLPISKPLSFHLRDAATLILLFPTFVLVRIYLK